MIVSQIGAYESGRDYSNYKGERRRQSFKTGALIGAALSIANDIFQHKNIKANYKDLVSQIGKNKAFVKTAGSIAFNLGAAMLFYGALNTLFGAIVDKIVNIGRVKHS